MNAVGDEASVSQQKHPKDCRVFLGINCTDMGSTVSSSRRDDDKDRRVLPATSYTNVGNRSGKRSSSGTIVGLPCWPRAPYLHRSTYPANYPRGYRALLHEPARQLDMPLVEAHITNKIGNRTT